MFSQPSINVSTNGSVCRPSADIAQALDNTHKSVASSDIYPTVLSVVRTPRSTTPGSGEYSESKLFSTRYYDSSLSPVAVPTAAWNDDVLPTNRLSHSLSIRGRTAPHSAFLRSSEPSSRERPISVVIWTRSRTVGCPETHPLHRGACDRVHTATKISPKHSKSPEFYLFVANDAVVVGGAIDAGVPWSAPSPPAVCPDFGRFGHETDRQTYQYNYCLTV